MLEEINKQITALEKKKADLLRKKEEEKEAAKLLAKKIVGKCFFHKETYRYRGRVGNSIYSYIKIIGPAAYNEGVYVTDTFQVTISPVGWKLNELGKLQLSTDRNQLILEYKNTPTSGVATTHSYTSVKYNENSNTYQFNSNLNPYSEITPAEYDRIYKEAVEVGNYMNTRFAAIVKPQVTNETEGLIPELNEATLTQLKDLLNEAKAKNIGLDKLLLAAGTVAKYNYFVNNQLPELVQWKLRGDKGLNLEINGGDGGSDYEPYTTHYYISRVQIDWAHILYPIRLNLKCKVMDLVAQLESLSSVYIPRNWECRFDTSTYDASFTSASLKPSVLNEVNSLIKKNLK